MRDQRARKFDARVDRLAVPYADAKPYPKRMTDGEVVPVPFTAAAGIVFSPSRAFDPASYPSGGVGMIGSAPDLVRFFETIRRGGGPILSEASVAEMMRDQIAHLTTNGPGPSPGWGLGFGGSVLADPAVAGSPQSPGTWQWGGAYGHSWFVDPERRLTVIALTNTALEGLFGKFPFEVRDAVYA